jgi:hypothetical protein
VYYVLLWSPFRPGVKAAVLAGVHSSNYVNCFIDHVPESGFRPDNCCICDYLTKCIVAGVHSMLSGVPVKMLFFFHNESRS